MALSVPVRLLVAGLLLAPLAANAQKGEDPPPGEVFVESIDVNVVNVDVVVTDKSGKRVTGLTRHDFELREDGKPVEVTNFYAEAGGTPAATSEAGAAPGEPIAIPEEQSLYLTLYFDNRSLTPPVRNRMIPALQRFVASRLRPEDRLLVASYDGTLKIRQAPTGDVAALTAALDGVAKSGARGLELVASRRQLLFDLAKGDIAYNVENPDQEVPPGTSPQNRSEEDAREVYDGIKTFAEQEYRATQATLGHLGRLVESLSGLPGRKVLLYVGGGLSTRPAETLVRAFLNKYGAAYADVVHTDIFDSFEQDTTKLFNQVVERANAHRVTFYTLGTTTVESRLSGEWGENFAYNAELEAIDRNNHTAPLATMAAGTGGLVAYDPSDPGVLLDRMHDDISSYYSLGYVPHNRSDGKTHKIEVLPKDRSLKVRHREGFRAQTQTERAASRTLSAMMLGVGQNPLDVLLGIEEETRDDKGRPVLSVLVMFPLSKVVLLPLKQAHEGRIRIFVGTRDAEGRTSAVSQLPIPIRVPNEQLLQALSQKAAFRIKVVVRPGEQVIAVSVRDELGNADSTATAKYTAGTMARKGGKAGKAGRAGKTG